MISTIISRLVILLFGTLYPAYASYKAVKTKNLKEYVKWMMYWIVFALFTCIETFTDVLLSWFPFYYEIKVVLVLFLLSPGTMGSSVLYRKIVHPLFSSKEQEIDDYISRAKEQSYKQVLDLGSKGMTVLMMTAIKGGGGIVNHLKKSYSLSDLSDPGRDDGRDESDAVVSDPRLRRRRHSPHRSTSTTSASMYFSEVDVRPDRIAHIQSAEDISSGYSSGEGIYVSGQLPKLQPREGLSRTGSLTRSRTTKSVRSTAAPKKTPSLGSDESDDNEVFDTNIIFLNDKLKKIDKLAEENPAESSSSEGEFLDTLEDVHGNRDVNDIVKLTACPETISDTVVVDENLTKKQTVCPTLNNLTKLGDEKKVDELADIIAGIRKSVESLNKPLNKQEEERGGKYNKKAAPPPPPPIKATLVLKPGVVKSIGSSSESCKEIFMHSPKSKRRLSSGKLNNLSKLIKLPKKLDFWKKDSLQKPADDSIAAKRLSWHNYLTPERELSDSKAQSKSDNDLMRREKLPVRPAPLQRNERTGSNLSIKSLTESPLAHRRLKIIRRYVDEDID